MTLQEYVTQVIDVPKEEMEPFCPFGCGYCDVAYTSACYCCSVAMDGMILKGNYSQSQAEERLKT